MIRRDIGGKGADGESTADHWEREEEGVVVEGQGLRPNCRELLACCLSWDGIPASTSDSRCSVTSNGGARYRLFFVVRMDVGARDDREVDTTKDADLAAATDFLSGLIY